MENPTSSCILCRRVNFEFAFNDPDFSDRVLHLQIMDASFDSNSDPDGCHSKDSENSTVVNAKTLHISSPILAGNSPFFHKLFKNGMRESVEREATLRISSSEEAAVMELLNFMYSNTLKATTTPDVLAVLVVADKFEASDCVKYCCEVLQKMPMSLESALLYIELPSSVLLHEQVQSLMDAAKKCLFLHYEDINKSQEEAMTLPLSAIEVLLGSDSLQKDLSEDDVFEFVLKWARAQYPELTERRQVLTKCLEKFIRFRYMSGSKLKEVLVCPDLDCEQVSKLMLEAFFVMVEAPYLRNTHASNKYQVVKVEKSEPTQPRCVVYFDLKKEDCENLSPSRCLDSQSFRVGAQSCIVDFEFEAMRKSSMKFHNEGRGRDLKFTDSSLSWGYEDLFKIPWTDLMSKESEYFIDGILHLRADIIVKDS